MERVIRTTEIHAIIPHPHAAETFVVDAEGNYPKVIHQTGEGTYERTFSQLGEKLGLQALSIDYFEGNREGCLVYRAKPPEGDLTLENGHSWGRKS